MSKFRKKYMERREPTRTIPKGETLTDQSQAQDCDLNVIVKRFMPGSPVAGPATRPQFGVDLTGIPTDLASAIHAVRNLERLRGSLPPEFKDLAIDDLLALTPEGISAILTKAQPAPDKKDEIVKDEKK